MLARTPMGDLAAVQAFLAERTVALVGASRNPKAFSSAVRRELESRGVRVLAVNPAGSGPGFFPAVSALPEKVAAALVMVPQRASEAAVREALAAGVRLVWLHQGSVSREAVKACEEAGVSLVDGRCILMFLEPVRSVHRFHRGLLRLLGRLPRL
jgi:predicted CoA-binding protein